MCVLLRGEGGPLPPLSFFLSLAPARAPEPPQLTFPSLPPSPQIKDIGSGNFGVAKLARDTVTGELVAVKFIERGDKVREERGGWLFWSKTHTPPEHPPTLPTPHTNHTQIDRNVERELVNHRSLLHPNIVAFREVFLTPTHLGIVMEYAAGGELFDRIVRAGRFSEDEARFFFQQLVSGVAYCHAEGVCHRDLKLENTLLDGGAAPRLKICDFGYSKSALFDSQPKSTVGTPAYIAPEVLSRKQYDGEVADVWSTGVTLYVMLVGAYPFEDPADPRNFRKTIQVREWWGGGVGREREKNITVFQPTHPHHPSPHSASWASSTPSPPPSTSPATAST